MEERDLLRCGEIADIDNVNVTARERADRSKVLLTDEDIALLACGCVVIPPHIVSLAALSENAAQRDRVGYGAVPRSADVEESYSLIPERRYEDPIADEHVVNERIPHHRGKD